MGSFWSQPLRVECTEHSQLITSRTINSRLWLVNNKPLEQRILAFIAKYAAKYQVHLYANVIVGNHYHLVARFPNGRRSEFFRDLNARIAEAVRMYVPEFIGGPLLERRFTPQVLPMDEDLEKYFFYCALQPVSAGLTEKISDYEGYNSFYDAVTQRTQTFRLFNYGAYNAAKRFNPKVSRKLFFEEHTLKYEQLPHLKHLSPKEYKQTLLRKLEEKRVAIVKDRKARGKKFFGKENLRKVVPGSVPKNTKKDGLRPLAISCCKEAKSQFLKWYFTIVERHRRAVEQCRMGDFSVDFPKGTFRPHGMGLCPP